MSLYDELQVTARSILKEFNQGKIELVQFVYPEESTPDNPAEPEEIKISLNGAAKGVSFKYLKEGFVTASDKEVTVAVVNGVEPTVDDFIDIDDVRYKILQFDALPNAGTPCAWKFIVHKGG